MQTGADEKGPAEGIREEQDDFLAASAGKHGAAQAFRRPSRGAVHIRRRVQGTIAIPDTKKTAADGMLTLALSWADEGCPLINVKK